jgi:CubicO group peptidase (beta-lactamase class C family)
VKSSAEISALLRARVSRGDVPAVVAAIVDRDRTLYSAAFGKRDVAADADITTDAIFRIASMTKPVTSLAAMILYDEGRLGLDDPVVAHLSDYRQPPVLTGLSARDGAYESRPAARQITIRDLLTHTSGIAYPFFNRSLAALVAAGMPSDALPLLHDPGADWTYGPSTAILARVLARAAGETIDTFFQDRIFDPLGMRDTGHAVSIGQTDRVVTQHRRVNSNLVEQPNPATIQSKGRGDDGLLSTAADYAKFLQLFLNRGRHDGRQIVSEGALEMMTSNQIGALTVGRLAPNDASFIGPFPFGVGKDKFGFGFQIETAPTAPGMRGAGSLSWSGVFNTYFWIDPHEEIAVVLLMQLLPANDDKAVELLREFERLVYRHLRQS